MLNSNRQTLLLLNYLLQTPQDGYEIRSMENAIASVPSEKFGQSRGNNISIQRNNLTSNK